MTDRRRPAHIGVFLGLSTGAYAVGLAAVTALQGLSEAAVLAERDPTVVMIAGIAAGHDALDAEARHAALVYQRSTDAYGDLSRALADVELQLADLSTVVGDVTGAARALPNHVQLPRVTRNVTLRAPTVHATTGASGG